MQLEPTPIELRWPVMGDRVDRYSGYRTYAAMVCSIPELKNKVWQLGGFSGANDGRFIKLGRDSEFMIRCQAADIHLFDRLTNSMVQIGQSFVKLGGILGHSIEAVDSLSSEITIIKLGEDTRFDITKFAVSVGKQLQSIGVDSIPEIGQQRSLLIKGNHVLGFEIYFPTIRHPESIALQQHGLGGKRRMGCGVFH